MVVALLLSIVAIYPLVNDLKTKEWDGAYRLVLGQVRRQDASTVSLSKQEPCPTAL